MGDVRRKRRKDSDLRCEWKRNEGREWKRIEKGEDELKEIERKK